MNVDANVVMQNLAQKISQLELELAVRNAMIKKLQDELNKDDKQESSK